MMDRRNQSGTDSTSGGVLVRIYKEGTLEEIIVAPSPSDSASTPTVVLLNSLSEQIQSALKQFMEISNTLDRPEALKVWHELQRYLHRTLQELPDNPKTESTTLSRFISPEDEMTFGMSEDTVRRLWDNEADRYWDNL